MLGCRQWTVWAVTASALLCAGPLGAVPHVAVIPLSTEASCAGGAFMARPLPHSVEPVPNLPMPFDSNGAGVAVADLDGDGWLDVVLGGLHGPATVLWNRGGPGGPAFDAVALELVGARAVAIVDVDGDGHQDIVATRLDQRPRWLRGSGGRAFRIVDDERFVARHPIYSMAWDDLDGDTDLDLVGATYDAELERYEAMEAYRNFVKTNVSTARTRQRGVWYYENLGPRDRRSAFEPGEFQFLAWPLAAGAMALAIVLTDVDGDALSDIVVGNDYDVPDNVFLRTPDRVRPHRSWWRPGSPFPATTRNTMAFATGDVDNDGRIELFAADMSPYRAGADIDEAWGPLLQPGGAATPVGDGVQAAANVLQTRQEDGSYLDTAGRSGVAATGWSWSAQFGDLDNDGDLDLYTVNGMVGDPFRNLENGELVEENQALRNLGGGRFVPAPEWGLGATESGRGMALGDLDRDGDLDIVVNNYRAPSLLFENRLCGGAQPAGGPGLVRHGQPVRGRRLVAARHRCRRLPARRGGDQRLPVQQSAPRPLRLPRRRAPEAAHHPLAGRIRRRGECCGRPGSRHAADRHQGHRTARTSSPRVPILADMATTYEEWRRAPLRPLLPAPRNQLRGRPSPTARRE